MEKLRRHWQITLLSLMTALLFIPFPMSDFSDYKNAIWDLGHVGYFFLLTRWLYGLFGHHLDSLSARILTTLLIVVLLSGVIEAIQFAIGRMASLDDAFNNLLGCLLALLVCQYKQIDGKAVRYSALFIVVLFAAWRLAPLSTILADYVVARAMHPVVANFETPFEMSRWRSHFPLTLSDESSSRELVVHLRPLNDYPGLTITPRVQDWRGYSVIQFEIFNNSQQVWNMHFRINDKQHKQTGFNYKDRYNTLFELSPGFNRFKVDLNQVKAAPVSRDMDMENIIRVSFFFRLEPTVGTIQFDNIVLLNE